MPNLNIAVEIASRGGQSAAGDVNILAGALGKLDQVGSGIASGLGRVVDGFGRLGLAAQGAQAVASSIVSVATGMVAGNAEMERYQIQLGTLLGSADAAKGRLAELAKFGAETPFELPEIMRAEKVLLGFGLTGERVLAQTGKNATEFRTVIGDIAAGTGARFEDVAATFGRFAAGASGEAISRLQEMGVATREQLKEMGIEFSKSGELVSPLDEALTAATEIAERKFGGGMKALSSSWEGMWSTLQDSLTQTRNSLTQPLFEALKPGLAAVNELLAGDGFQARLKETTTLIAGGLTSGLQLAGQAFAAMEPIVSRAGDLWATFTGALAGDWGGRFSADVDGVAKAIGTAGQVIGSLVDAVTVLIGDASSGGIAGLISGLGDLQDTIGEWLIQIPVVGGALAGLADGAIGSLTNLAEVAQKIFSGDLAGAVTTFLRFQIDSRVKLVENLAGWAESFIGWVGPMIPGLLAEARKIADAIVAFIAAEVPPLVERLGSWAAAFVEFVAPIIPPLLQEAGKLAAGLLAWVGEQAVRVVEALAPWAAAFVDWIGPKIPDLLREAGALAASLFTWIVTDALPPMLEKLGQWGAAFVEWVGPRIGPMLIELGKLQLELVNWIITKAVPAVVTEVGKLAEKFLVWVANDVLPHLPGKLAEIATAIGTWARDEGGPTAGRAIQSVGTAIVDGIKAGITGQWESFKTWLGGLMSQAVETAKRALDIKSPSQLFADDVGAPIVTGIMSGMETTWPRLQAQLNENIGRLVDDAAAGAGAIDSALASGSATSAGGTGGGSGGGGGTGSGGASEPPNTDGQTAPKQFLSDPLYRQLASNKQHGNVPGRLSMDFGDGISYDATADTYRGSEKPHPGKSGYYSVWYRINSLLTAGHETTVRGALRTALGWVFDRTDDRFDDQLGWRQSGARAMGGWMAPNGSYLVGETGPERVYMGSRGGLVVPTSTGVGPTLDYDRLARALAAQPITISLDRRIVGQVVRDEINRIGVRNGTTGL